MHRPETISNNLKPRNSTAYKRRSHSNPETLKIRNLETAQRINGASHRNGL